MKSFYDILGVDASATPDQIKKAYFAMAKKYHPDSGTEATSKTGKAELKKFHEITEAYKTLSEKKARKAYDDSFASPSRGEGVEGASAIRGNLYKERINSPDREQELRQYHRSIFWKAVFRTVGLSLFFGLVGYIDFLLLGGLWFVSLLAGATIGAVLGLWHNFDLDSWEAHQLIKVLMGISFVGAVGYFVAILF